MNGNNTEKPVTTTLLDIMAGARRLLLMHEALGVPPYPLTPGLRKFLQPRPVTTTAGNSSMTTQAMPPNSRTASASAAPHQAPCPPVEQSVTLGHVREIAFACDACHLGPGTRARVFGEGREGVPLLIVTEAPDDENLQHTEALSGEVRTLFIKMIAAIGLDLNKVYLTNIMKCKPPDNDTMQAMARHCLVILRDQIRAVRPKIILTMGPLPAAVLTQSTTPLLRLRGKVHDFHGLPLVTTYHPAFLLRHQDIKKAAWQDLQLLQRHMIKITGSK